MPQLPFAIQYIIPENQLRTFEISQEYFGLQWVFNIPSFNYSTGICFTENDENRKEVYISLSMNLGNVKKVEAEYTITIESANYSKKCESVYETSKTVENFIANSDELLDPEKMFIVDGKCIIKINGIFKFEDVLIQQPWNGAEIGDKLWENNDGKDFTISVDGKNIKVHKNVLGAQSDYFVAMFESGMKEAIENKVEITDFSFNIVETAVKLIYDCNFVTSLTIDDFISLFFFFDKYQISTIQDEIEYVLIDQISFSTVCRLTNASILTNSTNLKNKCIKFLKAAIESKTPLSDLEILDEEVEINRKMLYKTFGN